jgi:hypothetical protein
MHYTYSILRSMFCREWPAIESIDSLNQLSNGRLSDDAITVVMYWTVSKNPFSANGAIAQCPLNTPLSATTRGQFVELLKPSKTFKREVSHMHDLSLEHF